MLSAVTLCFLTDSWRNTSSKDFFTDCGQDAIIIFSLTFSLYYHAVVGKVRTFDDSFLQLRKPETMALVVGMSGGTRLHREAKTLAAESSSTGDHIICFEDTDT